jgi:hypothetical protein
MITVVLASIPDPVVSDGFGQDEAACQNGQRDDCRQYA